MYVHRKPYFAFIVFNLIFYELQHGVLYTWIGNMVDHKNPFVHNK